MTEVSKIPAKPQDKPANGSRWRPMETLRREVDRLFEEFDAPALWRSRGGLFHDRSLRRSMSAGISLSVDIVDKGAAYELTADVPGFDEHNIEVNVVNGALLIKGERHSEKEEKKKDYYLSEREFGAFERSIPLPDGVDDDKIEACVRKGVLTVTLPKTAEATKPAKKIEVKASA